MERAYFTTALPLRSSKQQHLVLKTDTEYRRWYNKCKKSGASSFFENRGQLLRRFGNEHDYGGDEYAVPMPTDGKIRALRRSLFRGSMLTKTAKRSTVSVLKRRTRPMEFSIRNVPPV